MSEVKRIADQLRRAYAGEAWHGDALSELLAGVTAAQAAARPVPGAHSIWEIVLHITAWLETARRRIETRAPVELSEAEDWPHVADASETAWQSALARLAASHQQLVACVAALDDVRLDETVAGRTHTIYFLLHGVIQHSLYHAGQIAILKRA